MKKMIIILCLVYICCGPDKQRESEIEKSYAEVVYIGSEQYVTVDKKGNIHLIKSNGEDKQIISYQEIETVLDREFTKADVDKSCK